MKEKDLYLRRLYHFSAVRASSTIIFIALFCTLAVKFFHAWRIGMTSSYLAWVLTDIAVLLSLEVALATVCFIWNRRWVIRTVIIIAATVCTWSFFNAGWLIRTGTQILPTVLLPLFRDPLNSLSMIGVNLVKMPIAAAAILVPGIIALIFLFSALTELQYQKYTRNQFSKRTFVLLLVVLITVLGHALIKQGSSISLVTEELSYNCQLRAITMFISPKTGRLTRDDIKNAQRTIPSFEQVKLTASAKTNLKNHNIVIIILEGIQYRYTSLSDKDSNLTPFLAELAEQGVEFSNTRSVVTHTTKAIFGLLTGRFPSVTHDIVEAVPTDKPYASLATILKQQMNFRTAFFQSAKGNFESRPSLIYNLGFETFWARDDLNDPNCYLGYLACDEFAMVEPIKQWIKDSNNPFLLTVLCSVTHDPYEVPDWFAETAKEPLARYKQSIQYTDKFIEALNTELLRLNLGEDTIFCVVGDHGEAFGEHGLLGHERITFEETLHIPWVIKAPLLVGPNMKITAPVSSIDLTPTLLSLLGFDAENSSFDGLDASAGIPNHRKVFFSGWMRHGPCGFVKNGRKFIHNPAHKILSVYDLNIDPCETTRIELPDSEAKEIVHEIIQWQKNTVFRPKQQHIGEKRVFNAWLCNWTGRVSDAKYLPGTE